MIVWFWLPILPSMPTKKIQLFDTTTKLVDATLGADEDVVVHQGGTSSSKTWSLLQVCFLRAVQEPGSIITVVGQDVPNLKKGAYRDAQTILKRSDLLSEALENHYRKEREMHFVGGSLMEFHSYDDPQDAKSGKRDYLFVNEANGIGGELYEELAVRTERQVYIDFNPTGRFWAHDKLKGRENVRWVRSTFQHNPYVKDSIKRKILSYKPTKENKQKGTANPYRWKVYGLGEVGRREGLVFPDFKVKPDMPPEPPMWGLDLGYTHAPTALVEVRETPDRYHLREWLYERGMTIADISAFLSSNGFTDERIVCDRNQRIIDGLKADGWNVVGAPKGSGSIMAGIMQMKEKKMFVTPDSNHLMEELSSYSWATDRDGNPTNKPIDSHNHLCDGGRYAIMDNQKRGEPWILVG